MPRQKPPKPREGRLYEPFQLKARHKEKLAALVGEELLPELEILARNHYLWEQSDQEEPTPKQVVSSLQEAATKAADLLTHLENLPDAAEMLIVERMHNVDWARSVADLSGVLNEICATESPKLRRGRSTSPTARTLAYGLAELFSAHNLRLTATRTGPYMSSLKVLLESIGRAMEDPLKYGVIAIRRIREQTPVRLV